MSWLLDPFQYGFMQRAFLGVLLISLSCATIGVYIVLRRMAFIGDALSHTVMPGIVVAHFNQWNLFAGALVASLISALGIGWLSRRSTIREDTAIGIVFTGMFAIGILYMSSQHSFRDFSHILFGNVIGMTSDDIILMSIVAFVVLSSLVLMHKELELTSFDPRYAAVVGLKAEKMRYILLVLCALAVVSAIQAVGVILTTALLITPAATASLLTKRLVPMMAIAVLSAFLSCIAGLYASYYFSIASGSAIVLVCIGFFLIAWVRHGLIQDRTHSANA